MTHSTFNPFFQTDSNSLILDPVSNQVWKDAMNGEHYYADFYKTKRPTFQFKAMSHSPMAPLWDSMILSLSKLNPEELKTLDWSSLTSTYQGSPHLILRWLCLKLSTLQFYNASRSCLEYFWGQEHLSWFYDELLPLWTRLQQSDLIQSVYSQLIEPKLQKKSSFYHRWFSLAVVENKPLQIPFILEQLQRIDSIPPTSLQKMTSTLTQKALENKFCSSPFIDLSPREYEWLFESQTISIDTFNPNITLGMLRHCKTPEDFEWLGSPRIKARLAPRIPLELILHRNVFSSSWMLNAAQPIDRSQSPHFDILLSRLPGNPSNWISYFQGSLVHEYLSSLDSPRFNQSALDSNFSLKNLEHLVLSSLSGPYFDSSFFSSRLEKATLESLKFGTQPWVWDHVLKNLNPTPTFNPLYHGPKWIASNLLSGSSTQTAFTIEAWSRQHGTDPTHPYWLSQCLKPLFEPLHQLEAPFTTHTSHHLDEWIQHHNLHDITSSEKSMLWRMLPLSELIENDIKKLKFERVQWILNQSFLIPLVSWNLWSPSFLKMLQPSTSDSEDLLRFVSFLTQNIPLDHPCHQGIDSINLKTISPQYSALIQSFIERKIFHDNLRPAESQSTSSTYSTLKRI